MSETEGYSKKAAATALHRDRSSVAAALAGVPGDAPSFRGQPRWRLATVRAAVAEHDKAVAGARATNENAALGGSAREAAVLDDKALDELKVEKLAYIRAKRIALERANEVASGEYVNTAAVDENLQWVGGILRGQLRGLGNKVASQVKMCTTIAEVKALIDTEVEHIMNAFCDTELKLPAAPPIRRSSRRGARSQRGDQSP